MIKQREKVVD